LRRNEAGGARPPALGPSTDRQSGVRRSPAVKPVRSSPRLGSRFKT